MECDEGVVRGVEFCVDWLVEVVLWVWDLGGEVVLFVCDCGLFVVFVFGVVVFEGGDWCLFGLVEEEEEWFE